MSCRHAVAISLLAVLAASPAHATCAETIMGGDEAAPYLAQIWAGLPTDYPYGRGVFARYTRDRIDLGPQFDKLEPATKRRALSLLKLGGVPQGMHGDPLFGDAGPITPMLPHRVYTADGRLLSMPYDGCERLYLWNERDRARVQFLGRGLPPRVINYPIHAGTERWVEDIFWRVLGGKPQGDIRHFAWVPERGWFEITIANDARWRYTNQLNRFWWYAPRLYKYVVVTEEGQQLETHGGLGRAMPPPAR